MKKIFLACAGTLAAAVLLVGCVSGGSVFHGSVEIEAPDLWRITYQKFNGSVQREVTLDSEGKHTFTVDIVTSAGSLAMEITDKDGTRIYSGNKLPSSSFGVEADGAGKYTIRFEGANHGGSFMVQWD